MKVNNSVAMKLLIVLCVCEVVVAKVVVPNQDQHKEHQCGVVASPNPLHQHPWLVHLEYYRRGVKYEKRCGGTLIDNRHVVTAAHCVRNAKTKNARLFVRLGEYDLSKEVDCVEGVCAHLPVKIEVSAVYQHPGYSGKEHDIAVLTLAYKAPYTDTIRPACLPTGKIADDVTFLSSGFGENTTRGVYVDIKKDLKLSYWSTSRCQAAFSNLVLPSHVICAGGEKGVDTCRGDSGGPLVWGKSNFELWGVTSTGNVVCGTKGSPGIYTSVPDHMEWIERVRTYKSN